MGIFEDCYKNKKSLPIVKPGTQTRSFTHVDDTVNACFTAWKKNKNRHYSISAKEKYSILKVAKLFKMKHKFHNQRPGERFVSSKIKYIRGNKIYHLDGKIKLKDYINKITAKNS